MDGMSLSFKMKRNDSNVPLGHMNINKLRDIKRIKNEYFRFCRIGDDHENDSEEEDHSTDK